MELMKIVNNKQNYVKDMGKKLKYYKPFKLIKCTIVRLDCRNVLPAHKELRQIVIPLFDNW